MRCYTRKFYQVFSRFFTGNKGLTIWVPLPVVLAGLILSAFGFARPLQVGGLTCEYLNNPVGMAEPAPRLNWKLVSGEENVVQTAYEIRVGEEAAALQKGRRLLWHTGKVNSGRSVHVPYEGPALRSRERCYWQVRVWDNHGHVSPWSEVQYWEMGLLQPSDWTAQWIQADTVTDGKPGPCPMFRKSFALGHAIRSARLYITAHGLYEAKLNGVRVGDDYFTPGWTSYHKRLQYQVYDVTGLLQKGGNVLGVTVGDGWYRGFLAFDHKRNLYGEEVALLCQLEVDYTDGQKAVIASDGSWRSTFDGPIRFSDIYNGEIYDARLEKTGWASAGYDDRDWKAVKTAGIKANLVASVSPPVRQHERFHPVRIFRTHKGETVLDFGQNLVGWVRLQVKGKAGDTVVLHHAEVLDAEGNFYTENLREAKEEVEYVLKGGGEEIFEPHFTFQGFRYVKVEGYPGSLDSSSLTAIALYSDMTPTGNFETSNPLINQLQHNIQWGQRGNFVDVPTDCPQRNERLGWTGDAEVFSNTAAFNRDVAAFFTKWLQDLQADQHADGDVPSVIPDVLSPSSAGSAGWADVATIIPWHLYVAYGDKRLLERQYNSMKAWVDYITQHSHDHLWNTGSHYGDWLFYSPPGDASGRAAVTSKYLIAQAFYAHSTQLLINAAKVLGRTEDVRSYGQLLDEVKKAFINEYMTADGALVSGTQTAYVLALQFDLLPENMRAQAAARLVQNIRAYGNHLTTGFLGTPFLCQVLTRFGYTDVAYTLLLQETYPSWLYPVKKGATTIWERWDGIRPDGSFEDPGMNSFNHYAYGAIGDWMYKVIAGIRPDAEAPGYKKIYLAPRPGGNLRWAGATLGTLYGRLASSWHLRDSLLSVEVTIPPNTTAQLTLPGAAGTALTENGQPVTEGATVNGRDMEVQLGSGTYRFAYPFSATGGQ